MDFEFYTSMLQEVLNPLYVCQCVYTCLCICVTVYVGVLCAHARVYGCTCLCVHMYVYVCVSIVCMYISGWTFELEVV